MKRPDLTSLSIDDLVKRFAQIGVEQDDALLKDEFATFNRLYKEKDSILVELKARSGDQRRALMALYRHENMQVRLNSAKATLAVAPAEARKMLERIADSHLYPQAGDAGMSLWNLDRGVFKPT